MIRFLFRYSRDARYIKLIMEIKSASPEAAGGNFPFSSLFAQLLGFSFVFGPASACRSPEGVCSPPRHDRVKAAADSGSLAHSGLGEVGVQNLGWACSCRGRHDVATAWGAPCVLPGSCPWITGPWQWWAAQAPGRGGVDSDLCLHTGFLVAAAAALEFRAHIWCPCW